MPLGLRPPSSRLKGPARENRSGRIAGLEAEETQRFSSSARLLWRSPYPVRQKQFTGRHGSSENSVWKKVSGTSPGTDADTGCTPPVRSMEGPGSAERCLLKVSWIRTDSTVSRISRQQNRAQTAGEDCLSVQAWGCPAPGFRF